MDVRPLPTLGTRLRLVLMAMAAIAIAIHAIATLALGLRELNNLNERYLTQLAAVTGRNLEAPLIFNDRKVIADTIHNLSSDTSVRRVVVTDPEGQQVAEFDGQATKDAPWLVRFLPASLNQTEILHPIVVRDTVVGQIRITASRDHFWQTVLNGTGLWILITLLALLASFSAARRLQQSVTEPVEQLERATREIAEQGQYSLRVSTTSRDEIGRLVQSFNAMLREIESRDMKLARYRDTLENQVQQRTAELEAATEAAEEASRVKSRFLANMSHEIRTPLTGILGMTRLLMAAPLAPQQHQLAVTAHRSGQILLDLLNGVLDYSRAEAGSIKLEPTIVNLPETIDSVANIFAENARSKGVQLNTQLGGDLPVYIEADPHRLKQVLFNLLGNATKFTEEGEVLLSVAASGRMTSGQSSIRFEVHDTGPGIPIDQQSRIFMAFGAGDSGRPGNPGGTGLGLAISRELVTLMGGELRLRSTPGKGSTFWFELPLVQAENQNPDREPHAPRNQWPQFHGRLLLVEDDPTNRDVALQLLRLMGCDATTVANGDAALEAVTKADYDLILMDCHMAGMDGCATARKLRTLERERGLPPTAILAVTAANTEEALQQCQEAGMNDILQKPFDEEKLIALLNAWLGPSAP